VAEVPSARLLSAGFQLRWITDQNQTTDNGVVVDIRVVMEIGHVTAADISLSEC